MTIIGSLQNTRHKNFLWRRLYRLSSSAQYSISFLRRSFLGSFRVFFLFILGEKRGKRNQQKWSFAYKFRKIIFFVNEKVEMCKIKRRGESKIRMSFDGYSLNLRTKAIKWENHKSIISSLFEFRPFLILWNESTEQVDKMMHANK